MIMDYTNNPFERALQNIFVNGKRKSDRTGTGTSSLFGLQMRWDLNHGFPLVTTKKLHTKSIITELLWMLSGSTNVKDLQAMGCTIWDEWAREDGSLGPVYGRQWRSWSKVQTFSGGEVYQVGVIDQIANVIRSIKTNPDDRGHVVSAWNVADLHLMALRPCHALFQFDVTDGKLSCQLYQRSADFFLGVPFNIASYALLTHMVAQQCDLEVGEFVWTGGDCHIYDNHREQVALQLSREPYPVPFIQLNRAKDIFSYTTDDVAFWNYQHHSAIPGPVAV